MNGRLAPALIAAAAAAGVVARAGILPEFLVQVRDPNVLGGALYDLLLHRFGYAIVLALCASLTAAAILLVAWRTRARGASDWHAALAAGLVAVCLLGRTGVSLDPIGWACAAGFCLLLDRDDVVSSVNAIAVLILWSLLQGGATLGAVLALVSLSNGITKRRCLLAAAACVAGALQMHAPPWHAYGAHALYLDSLLGGAQRDAIWSGGMSAQSAGFAALLVIAAWYGVRRRGRAADAVAFFTGLVLAMADARNLPYFAIVAAPVVADALASFYLGARSFPESSARQHAVTFLACVAAFAAILSATEPKVAIWPEAPGQPSALLIALARDNRSHHLLCTQPRWCDGAQGDFGNLHALLDDRAGVAARYARRVEADASHAKGPWRSELRRARVDAVIASTDDPIVALLRSSGWRAYARQGSRVLLKRE